VAARTRTRRTSGTGYSSAIVPRTAGTGHRQTGPPRPPARARLVRRPHAGDDGLRPAGSSSAISSTCRPYRGRAASLAPGAGRDAMEVDPPRPARLASKADRPGLAPGVLVGALRLEDQQHRPAAGVAGGGRAGLSGRSVGPR
jgi:hypothetical protein